jgi:ribonuclease BN (tRNA processing enzyme)
MTLLKKILLTLCIGLLSNNSLSHELNNHKTSLDHDISQATYLGNEGVMVKSGNITILFDPFFHNSYGNYTLVPSEIRDAIFNNKAPYDKVNALFISHAHGDHFDKNDVLTYLLTHAKVKLIAPKQAVDLLRTLKGFENIKNQITSIELEKGSPPKKLSIDGIQIEAVRIPHAGWPSRAEVENIVFRVMLNDSIVVMHMGDADPNQSHFNEQSQFWPKKTTNTAFPPYWFSLSKSGKLILEDTINAKDFIGVHVPTNVPKGLVLSKDDYFSKPGESRDIPYIKKK